MRSSKYAPSFRKMLAVFTAVFLMGICSAPMVIAADPAPTASLIVKMTVGLTAAEQATVIAADGGTETSTVPALRLHIIKVPAADLPAVMQKYLSDPRVSRVEENKQRKVEAMVPFDPYFGAQWALTKIGWGQVFNTPPKGTAVVAVLDTGVDASHPDLAGKIMPGVSILDSATDGRTDSNGHGTSLAGIVAANTDNHAGIAGVGYAGVSVMPVTVLGSDGTGQDGDIIGGVIWAADHGANVILMGFSNAGFSQNLQDAIDYAWAKNIVVVAATGNNGQGTPTYPAGHRGVIGVSATDQNDVLAPFSNYGLDVFLAAPGVDIITTARVNTDSNLNYQTINGTSASSAFVAGVAGFMKAMNPTLTNGAILGRLARGADPAANPKDPAFTGKYGYGRVNMAKALADTGTAVLAPVGAATAAGGVVGPYRAAAACIAATTGNWNAAGTWTGCGATGPVAGDSVFINTGVTVTVPAGVAAACATIGFSANVGAASSIELASNTSTLTVSGAVTIQARSGTDGTANTNTINVGAGTFSAASVALQQSNVNNKYSQINISTGTVTITGNLTSAGTGSRIAFSGAGTLNFGGASFMSIVSGTFTASSTSTVNFYGAGDQIISPFAYTFDNVTLSGSGVKTLSNATITRILSLEGTATTLGTPAYTGPATIKYKGSGNQTTGSELPDAVAASGGVIIANTAGVVTLGKALILNPSSPVSSLTINSGASFNTNSVSNYALTFGTDFINNGTLTANGSPITITGNINQSISGFTTTGDVSMTKGGGTATFTGNVSGNGIGLTGNGILNLGAGLNHTFTGTWTRTAGTLNCNSSTLNLGGSLSGSGGTFTKGSGTVNYNAAGIQTIAAVIYNNLTFSGSGAKTMPTGTTVGGTLRIGTGTKATIAAGQTLAVGTLYLGGIGQVNGTWGSSSSTASHKDDLYFTSSTGVLSVTTGKAAQTITVTTPAPATAVYNTSFTVAATASSGLTVTYSSGSAGVCTNVGATFTMVSGTGACVVQYDQSGSADFSAAPQVTSNTTAQQIGQTISVTTAAPATAAYNTSFTVAATAGSGLAVSYSSGNNSVCTNVGALFTMVSGTGTCVVQYDQPGSADYSAAPQVTSNTTAQKIGQTITVTTPAPGTAAYNTSFTVAATAGTGLTVSYSSGNNSVCTNVGALFTMVSGTGTCIVRYDQSGSADYNAAPQVTSNTTAQQTGQTITVTTHAPATGLVGATFPVAANANSGLDVAISTSGACSGSGSNSATITLNSTSGTCTVSYNQVGNGNYTAATQVQDTTTVQTTVTVKTIPAGRSFTVDTSAPYTSEQTFTWTVGTSHTIATTSPQAGDAGTRYVFANWSDNGAQSHSVTTPATATTYTATFTTQYQLNTTFDVTKGYVLPMTGGWYNKDTMVNLTATPNSGNLFINWTGGVTVPTSAATTILMNGFKSVTANFDGTPYLTARVTGKSGLIDNRIWTITLTNTGTGTATGVYITGLTIDKGAGTTCTATVKTSLLPPGVPVVDVAVGSPKTSTVTLDFTGCASANIFSPTITFSYSGKTGSNSYYNMLR